MKASSCAVARHYSRCTRVAIAMERASSRRRPMSTSSLASSSIDSNASSSSRCNHRHHRTVVGEEALLMKPAGASGGASNEGSREGSMTIDWDKATERHRVQDMIHSKASSTSSSPPFASAPSSSVTPSLGNSGEIADGFVSHRDATSNNGGGGVELGGPAVVPPVNQGRPIKNWRVSKEAASLLACQGSRNKAAKGAEAYSVAHCLEVPPPASGDTRGVSKQPPETVEGEVSAREQRRVTGEGRVDKDLLLSELLVELHRRVKLLVGLQRQKRNQQRRTRVEPLMPLMPRQAAAAAAAAAPASPEEMADGEGDELYGLEALEFFKRIRSLGAYPPPTLCSLLVQLLAAEGMLEEAEEQFADMLKYGMLPSESCATMVIRLRVQRGKLAEAMEVLAMMEGREYQQKFCRPRFRSYQPVICELLRRGEMDGVMQLWKHMEWHSIRPKESFLLDLIEGIANNHHASSRDSLTQLADHLLDGMSKTLIYPSAPTVKALVEGWNATWTDVSEQGTCTTCGEMLQGTRLTPEDRARMRSSIVHIAAQNGAREVQRLSWFANWFCSLEDPPTAIIDGPNVGFMNQNFKGGGFSLTQVDWLAEHLKSKGERVLITMPWYYCKDDNFPMRADRRESRGGKARKFFLKRSWTPIEAEIVQKWVDNQWLVMVEGLDDLYWMYATVARDDVNTLVVTNDLMRDHRNFFPGSREFVRWKRSHLVSFSFRWEKDGPQAWVQGKQPEESPTPPAINLSPGASWKEVQRTGSNWHLPVRVRRNSKKHNYDKNSDGDDGLRDHAEPIKSCLCIPMPTSMTRASDPSPSSSSTYSRPKKSSLLPTGDGGMEQREEGGDRYRRTINTA